LDERRLAHDVIEELVARGMPRPAAQRFVDRALAQSTSPSASPPARPFQWKLVLAIAAIPVVVLAFVAGHITWGTLQRERAARAAAAAELAAADRSRTEEIRGESSAQRDVANRERTARLDARVAKALTQLSSNHPMTQCDAALLLGRLGSREQAPPLVDLMAGSTFSSVRGCAAAALVDLGETGPAMAAYTEWAQGNDADLRRSALGGFGDIGPSAARVALPYLTEALKSPHMDLRYLAVDALAKLGPAAVPLLEVASGDADKDVRALAVRALSARTPR
jgi:HEAT repeat protein